MSLPLPKHVVRGFPEPGTPEGFYSEYDEALWTGWDKTWTVPAHVVSVFRGHGDYNRWRSFRDFEGILRDHLDADSDFKSEPVKPTGYRGSPPLQIWVVGNEVIKVMGGNLGGHVYGDVWSYRRSHRDQRTGDVSPAMSARDIIQRLKGDGLYVACGPRPVAYERTTKQKALPRIVWRAAWKAAYLCNDPKAGDVPGLWERRCKTTKVRDAERVVTVQSVHMVKELLDRRNGRERALWFAGSEWFGRSQELTDDDRGIPGLNAAERDRLGGVIIDEVVRAIVTPPTWSWWAGEQFRPRKFLHYDNYTGRRVPLGIMSFANKPSAMRTLIEMYVGPGKDACINANLGHSPQQSLMLLNQGQL
jgi:hypothetical protein